MAITLQEHVIKRASRVEHYAVRRREWEEIRTSLTVMRPSSGWMANAGWVAFGAAASGGFTLFGLYSTTVEEWIRASVIVATIASTAIAALLLLADRQATARAGDGVEKLQKRMDDIAAECDQETALQ